MTIEIIKQKKARLWILTVLFGFILSVYYHYFRGVVRHLPYPKNTFLFNPDNQFADFTNLITRWYQYLPHEPTANISYFPFTYLIIGGFRFIADWFSTDFALYSMFVIFIFGFIKTTLPHLHFMERLEKYTFLLVALFFTLPFVFAFDRANLELIVFLFLSYSFYYYKYDKQEYAGALLGLATAMKLFPGALIFIFIFQKKWKAVKFTIGSVLLSTICGLLYLPESIFDNIQRMLLNMKLFNDKYLIQNEGLDFGTSLFGVIKILRSNYDVSSQQSLVSVYTPLILLLFALLLFFIYKHQLKLWEQLTVFIAVINLFPFVSNDYKLIHLFIPFIFWLDDNSNKNPEKKYWLTWGLLFIPKRYGLLFSPLYDGNIIDPLLMIFLIVNICYDNRNNKMKNISIVTTC